MRGGFPTRGPAPLVLSSVAGLARLRRAIATRTPHGFLASQCAGGSPQGGPAPLVLSNVAGLARLCRAIAPRTPHGFLASQCAGGVPHKGGLPPLCYLADFD